MTKSVYSWLDKVKSWHNFLLIIAGFVVGIFAAGGYFQEYKNSLNMLGSRVGNLEEAQKESASKMDVMQQKFNDNAIQFTELKGRITSIEQNLSFQTRSLDKIESAMSKLADEQRR